MGRFLEYLLQILKKKIIGTKGGVSFLSFTDRSHMLSHNYFLDLLLFCSVQDASLAKMKWALGAYERWRKFRAEIFSARYTASWTRNNRPIEPIHEVAATVDDLKRDVCDFIVEIRKENGDQYPSSSLYDLLQGLSMYLEREKGFENKLMSGAFRDIRNTLDNMMKERAAEGIKSRPEREPIMEDHEEILWQKGVLGEDSPDKLRYTIFFLIGVRFGLCGLSEQYNLRRYPDCQINIVRINGKDALVYREFQSKTRQGGISDRGRNPPRVSYAFCNGCRSRCFVELFRKYMFLAPQGNCSWPKFYVQTDSQWQPGSLYWYTNRPVGKNTLSKYIKTIMEAGGIEGHYRNHSTRKSTCTRLFQKGVDPQLIKEQTGHKSDAIMRYKKSNLEQKKAISDMLSVLPKEMQAIRDREQELMSEKKKKEAESVISPSRKSVVMGENQGLDVHVPVSEGFDFQKLQGLVNIHLHFHAK